MCDAFKQASCNKIPYNERPVKKSKILRNFVKQKGLLRANKENNSFIFIRNEKMISSDSIHLIPMIAW